MKMSTTTPILIILGLTLLLCVSFCGAMAMQSTKPPEIFPYMITTIVGSLLTFLQHRTQDSKDSDKTNDSGKEGTTP